MAVTFRSASRSATTPLIGLYGQSGSGKTYSALLLARGYVGPQGKIVMVDTERGRGEMYAEEIPGGYQTGQLEEPFSPARYREALSDALKANPDVIIIDSASHEWEGVGGVCEQAGEIEARTGKSGLHCWKKPKEEHKKFVLEILRSPVPIILCLRGKHKTKQGKDRNGKTVIVKDEFTTPIQSDDFIFEMTVHAEVLQGTHGLRVTKDLPPALADIFPQGKPISLQTGQKLAEWSQHRSAADPAPVAKDDGPPPSSGAAGAGDPKPSSALAPHEKEEKALEMAASDEAGAFTRWWNTLEQRDQDYLENKIGADIQRVFKEAKTRRESADQDALI